MEAKNIVFIDGKAIVKQGRKVIAKIFDKAVFYPLNKIKSGYSHRYNLELKGMSRECDSVDECLIFLNKYA